MSIKLKTKQKVQEAWAETVGAYYNSMLDDIKEDFENDEIKEVLLDATKLIDYIYLYTVSSLQASDKNIKFDGTSNIKQYISGLLLDDIDDVIAIQNYIKSLSEQEQERKHVMITCYQGNVVINAPLSATDEDLINKAIEYFNMYTMREEDLVKKLISVQLIDANKDWELYFDKLYEIDYIQCFKFEQKLHWDTFINLWDNG